MSVAVFRPVIAVALAAALTGCGPSDRIEEFGGPTMGSTYSVKYLRTEGVAPQSEIKAATEAILADIDLRVLKESEMNYKIREDMTRGEWPYKN